ncbi:hypothetical protein [Pyxidicoccus xibeiensis]|uniref:hypothetical protein n=1 Tax=Pyxidicoccus xibeiensis TaxID=2906759 RepID=UPI0020A83308|nr:hypothetical protein [Pyxidicoccus xibeiensis]MCP3136472.1 hypothetical protein [Pyxidicoccus xibeiensis]
MGILAAGLAACGGGVEQEDFGSRAVEALCEREARCGVYSSEDACEQELRRWSWDTWLGLGTRHDAALESGRLSYDEDAAERCLDALREGDCRLPALTPATHGPGIEYEPACRLLRADKSGGDCQSHLECGEDAYCAYAQEATCQGTCKPLGPEGHPASAQHQCAPGLFIGEGLQACERPAKQAEPCYEAREGGARERPCAPGLWCDREGSGKCEWTGAVGDACGSPSDARCGTAFVCKDGRCARRGREGASCRAPGAGNLVSTACQQDLFCDGEPQESGTCRKRRAEGTPCRNHRECAGDLGCMGAAPDSGVWGTCGKRPALGEACAPEGDLNICGGRLGCASGKCLPFVHPRERCGPDVLCILGSCLEEGICVPAEAIACW